MEPAPSARWIHGNSPDMQRIPDQRGWTAISLYSLPAAGSNFMENLIGMYLLKFATDVLLLAPGLVALFFGLARVWDAVSDPIVGYWSDRTRHRMGRRRPWILASALPLGLAFVAVWSPPDLAPDALRVWVCAAVILFYTAQTALAVPHLAWGAELAASGHDRTRVFAGRLAVGLGGIFLAAGAMGALERSADPRATASGVAVAAALLVVVTCVVAVGRLRERPDYQGRGARTPYTAPCSRRSRCGWRSPGASASGGCGWRRCSAARRPSAWWWRCPTPTSP